MKRVAAVVIAVVLLVGIFPGGIEAKSRGLLVVDLYLDSDAPDVVSYVPGSNIVIRDAVVHIRDNHVTAAFGDNRPIKRGEIVEFNKELGIYYVLWHDLTISEVAATKEAVEKIAPRFGYYHPKKQ